MILIIRCSSIIHSSISGIKGSSLPFSLFVCLALLPPHSPCCRSVTSSPRPHPWQRKTLPTGRASRWRLKPRRDREIQTPPDNTPAHLSEVPRMRHTYAEIEAASSTQVQSSLWRPKVVSEDVSRASDTFCQSQTSDTDKKKLQKTQILYSNDHRFDVGLCIHILWTSSLNVMRFKVRWSSRSRQIMWFHDAECQSQSFTYTPNMEHIVVEKIIRPF